MKNKQSKYNIPRSKFWYPNFSQPEEKITEENDEKEQRAEEKFYLLSEKNRGNTEQEQISSD